MGSLRVTVHAGERPRLSPLIRARLPVDAMESHRSDLVLADEDSGTSVPAQYDPSDRTLSFVLHGALAAGTSRRLRLSHDAHGADTDATFAASFVTKLDRVELLVAGRPFGTYVVAGTRRPYVWPLLGPAGGSVVRGQGSADHPHHTGLALNYGGHSEDGSVNIWSDWDEPPYGPGGRMLHRGFRRLLAGRVYGEVVHDLTYVDADGDPFATEIRTLRWWWSSPGHRYLDLEVRVLEVRDIGSRPFLLMIRTPPCFGIPRAGKVTNAAGAPVPALYYADADRYRAAWVDASGPTAGPPPPPPAGPPEELLDLRRVIEEYEAPGTGRWNGIAVFDHPDNNGFPNVIGKYATALQITQAHYPPVDARDDPFSFRHRVLVHDGDADAAGVAQLAADYAHPCEVEVG